MSVFSILLEKALRKGCIEQKGYYLASRQNPISKKCENHVLTEKIHES